VFYKRNIKVHYSNAYNLHITRPPRKQNQQQKQQHGNKEHDPTLGQHISNFG
jgi:hypothetical protein